MLKNSFAILALAILSLAVQPVPAFAIFGDPVMSRSSAVSTAISYSGGVYGYDYTVTNTSTYGIAYDKDGALIRDDEGLALFVWPLIVDYEVPLTAPGDIWGISSPTGWAYEILSDADYVERYGEHNPFSAPYILHWHDAAIVWDDALDAYTGTAATPIVPTGYNAAHGTAYPENYLSWFIFSSNLAPVDGPYLSSWQDEVHWLGDPPLPGGSVAGGTIPFNAVPEPSSLLLVAAGLLGAAGVRRFMRK